MARQLARPLLALVVAAVLTGCAGTGASGGGDLEITQASITDRESVSAGAPAQAFADADQGLAQHPDLATLQEVHWSDSSWWTGADGSQVLQLSAPAGEQSRITAWIDSQDWTGWSVNETAEGSRRSLETEAGTHFVTARIVPDTEWILVEVGTTPVPPPSPPLARTAKGAGEAAGNVSGVDATPTQRTAINQ